MKTFDVPKSGKPLTSLGPVVQALAKACNGLINLRFESGDDWKFDWEEGGAVLTYPDDGNDNLWWTVAVNGQVQYAQFRSSAPTTDVPDDDVQNPF